MEAIHLSQTGALITLLIDKFLNTHHLAVSRICDTIACKRVELLLADNIEVCSREDEGVAIWIFSLHQLMIVLSQIKFYGRQTLVNQIFMTVRCTGMILFQLFSSEKKSESCRKMSKMKGFKEGVDGFSYFRWFSVISFYNKNIPVNLWELLGGRSPPYQLF